MELSIIVPLDGSELAEAALPWALAIARRHATTPVICSVIDVSTEFAAWITSDKALAQDDLDTTLAERRGYLDDICGRYNLGKPVIDIRVGSPSREILACATEHGADLTLIVMGTHGRGGLTRLAMGSVALRVVGGHRGPILTVRGEHTDTAPRFERVLAPVDGSELSEQAIDVSLKVLGKFSPHVRILQVLGSPDWAASVMRQGLAGEYLRASQELAEEYTRGLAASLSARDVAVTSEVRELGNVVEQILESAGQDGSDIIAMATHGRGGLGRVILGSVADGVVRGSSRPVLLVHAPGE